MSALFSKSAIKQAISSFQGHDLSREIAIVQELFADYKTGNTKDETRYEQRFNNMFFGQLLGYEENIHRHPKASTPVGQKTADVGLGFFEDGKYSFEGLKVVVELKGSDTLLDKKQSGQYAGQSPVDQGFGYKTSFKDCPWLIVSNFASIRLYRDNKQDFEVWTIEDLAKPDHDYYHLKTLLALLKRNRLIRQDGQSETERLLSAVRIKQEQITKDFYKQYKTLRFELINDIRHHNPDLGVEIVVEKAQKIIDRIVFVHFCEDKGLLPEGRFSEVISYGEKAMSPTFQTLSNFFEAVNSGSPRLEIPNGYNGGLFHEDKVLNNLKIGDSICRKFVDLGKYNFDDELSVNILGHIFEQSISDIEQLKGELLGQEITTDELVEKKESKRKKDGIFYTPEYIVDYIVQNSLMVYLEEKENECLAKYKKEHEAYQAYQHILQNIKVLDPACGSGAFLVRVFDYLYAENKRVGEIIGGLFATDEIYKSILRNNIYGVDLNPESVEITKLSLWLKSAQKGKKLNNLDDNIKCGNSLIDDPAVAGDRAFDRKKEFPDIMGAGGFDVIVGNPPYVRADIDNIIYQNQRKRIIESKKYTTLFEKRDLYLAFLDLGIQLLRSNGKYGMIIPDAVCTAKYGQRYRELIIKEKQLYQIDYFPDIFIFPGVGVKNIILFLENKKSYKKTFKIIHGNELYNIINQSDIDFSKTGEQGLKLNFKKEKHSNITLLGDICYISKGMVLNADEKTAKGEFTKEDLISIIKTDIHTKKYVEAKDIKKYQIERTKYLEWDTDRIPKKVSRPTFNELYEGEKIMMGSLTGTTFDSSGIITNHSIYHIKKYSDLSKVNNLSIRNSISKRTKLKREELEKISKAFELKYILSIINSKRGIKYLKSISRSSIGIYPDDIKKLPIKNIPLSAQQPFIAKADLMLSLNKELHDKTDSFLRYISSKFGLEKLSTKLQKFTDYDFATFLKELKSKRLSMSEEAELMEFFENKKKEILELKNKIDATDREIDEMVFELYGLSEEEMRVVLDN